MIVNVKVHYYVDSVEYRYSVDKIVLSTAAILTFSTYISQVMFKGKLTFNNCRVSKAAHYVEQQRHLEKN